MGVDETSRERQGGTLEGEGKIRGLYAGELPGTEPPPVATLQVVEGDGELASLRKVIEEQAATIKTLTTMLAGREATA